MPSKPALTLTLGFTSTKIDFRSVILMIKKWVFRFLKFLGLLVITLLLLIFALGDASSQVEFSPSTISSVQYDATDFDGQLDSLKALYGKNKILPEGHELQALLALSHYPELRDVHVEFVQVETLIPLSSRPKVFSKMVKPEKQKYLVVISTKSTANLENVLLKNLPFNAQVGVLGHELGHTVYYLDKGFWDVLRIGISYLFPGYREKFEKDTDRRTINHGLGNQLYSWAKFIREKDDKEKRGEGDNFLDKYYLTPAEIRAAMENFD